MLIQYYYTGNPGKWPPSWPGNHAQPMCPYLLPRNTNRVPRVGGSNPLSAAWHRGSSWILHCRGRGFAAWASSPSAALSLKLFCFRLCSKLDILNPRYLSWSISTWGSPSIDVISFPCKIREVRAEKLMWPISFNILGLPLLSALAITYIGRDSPLPIEWYF